MGVTRFLLDSGPLEFRRSAGHLPGGKIEKRRVLPMVKCLQREKMTTKEKILSVLDSLDENVSIDHAIDRLHLLRKVEIGLQQATAGDDLMEHDEFMQQLEDEETN
jgi:hypothetical protein